ncbi:MAG TPA: metalloregulator ArsR/SmtB family transcription factor [Thermomicrobiales bacterium]|nr:metalloregulator ArsR/SmtB family transcription factor [Thermomicrobiales bacterium]
MDHRAFKDSLYGEFARIGKALANPHRLEFLDLLAQREWSVEELSQETRLSVANASQHLQVLRAAQLVETRRNGLRVYYRLADADVYRLLQVVRDLSERRLAEIDRIVDTFLGNRDEFEPIDATSLLRRLNDENVVVLDVRPPGEYRAGHLPGARSIPIDELEARLGELSPDREIVAYCRGPYCVYADEAVELLAARGYRAQRFTHGFPDWQVAGLPVERDEVPS